MHTHGWPTPSPQDELGIRSGAGRDQAATKRPQDPGHAAAGGAWKIGMLPEDGADHSVAGVGRFWTRRSIT